MRASLAKTGVKHSLSVLNTHGPINCWIAQWCPPSTTTAIWKNLISVSSPVYSNEEENEIVGEYVFSLFYDLNGRSVETIFDQGFKTTLLTYNGYPLSEFAYTKTYIADNKPFSYFPTHFQNW
ncbi:hypothetical protein [Vibrio sp. 03_296]|uniref:hypothetical protein n=1 Tax=Vibrio sp. 03_296 TaxID=2024409 RepID=UPI002D7E9B67|nr:hypothetical protein [Vibrio sp. 03_296]